MSWCANVVLVQLTIPLTKAALLFNFRQVGEFVEFGDMDMMLQYLKDVQAVQRKITELSETITFINEVSNCFQPYCFS